MTPNQSGPSRASRNRYVVAMMLGTALTALSSGNSLAAQAPETTDRAVADMSRYCTTCWRNARLDPSFWPDCTQEVFSRLLQRVAPDCWTRVLQDEGAEHREFLRAIDAVKKRTQRGRKFAPVPVDSAADARTAEESRLAEDREAVRRAAAALLSERQQRILRLSFEGCSVHEIAADLDLPPERVSDEKYKAVRKLRAHLLTEE